MRLQDSLRNVATVDLTDAGRATSLVQGSCFDVDQQTNVVGSITALVSNPPTLAESRTALKPQDHLHFESYMTDIDWTTLSDPDGD